MGLAGGLAVGSGLVAFLTVLDVIPRLTVLTRSISRIHWYEGALVMGAVVATWVDFRGWHGLDWMMVAVPLVGLIAGCFVGLLAAGLTEVLNVLPILAKRLGMQSRLPWLLLAMIFGKVVGSLFQWLVF
ncbi:stage V sporulation protein AB [Desmospora activa DSM 45169]|uniref:Stage V sporulation protein AB n=1 Tax=Desmospora activa DSM 45169 TaxID=1121389 RepID=A0A2T4Z9P0_9BACL|nr:stage V sporulation protein AB [Desmospora activa DSM 45169]